MQTNTPAFVPGGKPQKKLDDDAIVSVEEAKRPERARNAGGVNDFFSTRGRGGNYNKQSQNRERELEKYDTSHHKGAMKELEEMDGGEAFDQFKNRKTTYNEEIYNLPTNESKLTEAQKAYAEKMQAEINNADSKGNVHLAEERG